MTTRRTFLVAPIAWALAAPFACHGQTRPKVARLGILEPTSSYAQWRDALIAGLRELGLVEGKNIIIDHRWGDGNYERLSSLASNMVQSKPDVLVAATVSAVRAARLATASIPIIMVRTGDPVGTGLVASLSRPGGNVTGLSNISVDVISKYLELLHLAVPGLLRAVLLVNPGNPIHGSYLKQIQATQKTSGVSISVAHAGAESQIEPAFGTIRQERAGALIVPPDSLFFAQGQRIAELAVRHRLPTMFSTRDPVEAGGLMSYGQNFAEHYYRAATYVDKILRGAKPGDLPVEQPTKIELVVNLRTARAIGLAIPQEFLFRADKVIE